MGVMKRIAGHRMLGWFLPMDLNRALYENPANRHLIAEPPPLKEKATAKPAKATKPPREVQASIFDYDNTPIPPFEPGSYRNRPGIMNYGIQRG